MESTRPPQGAEGTESDTPRGLNVSLINVRAFECATGGAHRERGRDLPHVVQGQERHWQVGDAHPLPQLRPRPSGTSDSARRLERFWLST